MKTFESGIWFCSVELFDVLVVSVLMVRVEDQEGVGDQLFYIVMSLGCGLVNARSHEILL